MSRARDIIDMLRERGQRLAVAESCTGGLLAAAITDIPGASDVFDCAVVCYANEIKARLLAVDQRILAEQGAVCHATARAMAAGARELAAADIAISTTGIAGPGGGSEQKPVGLVYIGLADGAGARSTQNHFAGDRQEVRRQTVDAALALLYEYLSESSQK